MAYRFVLVWIIQGADRGCNGVWVCINVGGNAEWFGVNVGYNSAWLGVDMGSKGAQHDIDMECTDACCRAGNA